MQVADNSDKLTLERLHSCVERIEQAKKLPKSAYYEEVSPIQHFFTLYGKEWKYFPTLGIVFAFDSGDLEELRSFLNKTNKQKDLSIEQQVDLVCILKRGLIVHYDPKDDLIYFPPEPRCELRYKEGMPEENLALFYRIIMRILSQVWTRPIRITDYFKS